MIGYSASDISVGNNADELLLCVYYRKVADTVVRRNNLAAVVVVGTAVPRNSLEVVGAVVAAAVAAAGIADTVADRGKKIVVAVRI